jgi:thiosulfate dehydrogenase (quinone) large subunit
MNSETRYSSLQEISLIALRTLIGWHFLYEAYYKLMLPGWSADGTPLAPWSSAGFLKASSGPLGALLQKVMNSGWTPWIDNTVKIGLLLVGVSLILGLLTRLGCIGAMLLLSLFYLSAVPVAGLPQPGSEGTYLIVNKTLIEGVAVLVLFAFNTGRIAGIDLLLANRRASAAHTLEEGGAA